MANLKKAFKAYISILMVTTIVASVFAFPIIADAALCDDLAKGKSFISCGDDQTSFTNFKGGLQAPEAEGYAPELTQASSARQFILQLTNFILGFLGLAAVLAIVYGGILYVSAGGEEDKATKGKKSIMYAVVGLLVVMSSWAIVRTVIQAPSGTESGTVASQQGALKGSAGDNTTGGRQRTFNVAAARIQSLSRNFISSYENYLETEAAISQYYNVESVPQFQTAADLVRYMQQKESILTNIENKSRPLGVLREMTRINKLMVQKFTQLGARAIEQLTSPDAKDWDPGNLLFGIVDGLAGLGEGLSRGFSGYQGGVLDFTKSSRAQGEREKLAAVGNNINLIKGNISDFEITVDEYQMEIADIIELIAGEKVVSANPEQKVAINSETLTALEQSLEIFALASAEQGNTGNKNAQFYTIQNPQLAVPQSFKTTEVGIKYEATFKALQEAQKNPNNFTVRSTIDALGELYETVKDLQFIDAVITASATGGNAPLPVTFDSLKSLDPNGQTIDPSRVTWDFDGDGSTDESSGNAHAFIFNEPGTYRAKLVIKSKDSKTILDGYDTITITVQPPKSHINLNYEVSGDVYEISRWSEEQSSKTITEDFGTSITNSGGSTSGTSKTSTSTKVVTQRRLEVDRKSIAVTLEEAKNGIKFNASGTRNQFYEPNKIKRYTWNFGDNSKVADGEGQTAEQATDPQNNAIVTHKYSKGGTYKLVLEIEDDAGVIDRKIIDVIVRDTAARIKASPSGEGNVGQEFRFDGSGSASSTGQITSYKWSIEKLRQECSDPKDFPNVNEDNIRYTFEEPCDYKIGLEVEDNVGEKSTDEHVVSIVSQPPVAQFSYQVPHANKPNVVHFDGSKSFDPDGGGEGIRSRADLSYKWEVNADAGTYEFSPPLSSNDYIKDASRPIVKFKKKGDYTVSLIVKDKSGRISEISERTVKVDKILSAEWNKGMKVTNQLKDGKSQITFKANSENAATYEIRYGDGEKDSGEVSSSGTINTTHSYEKADEYEIELIVFDDENDETIISRKVFIGDGTSPMAVIRLSINDEVAPEFTSPRNPLMANRKDVISFDASESINLDGTGRRLDYAWDFNDGNRSTKRDLQRSYQELSPIQPGFYLVRLTVTDKDTLKKGTDEAFVRIAPEPPEFLGVTAVPTKQEQATPMPVKVNVVGAEDPDGEIIQYRWWYYDVSNPEDELGYQITTTPSTLITIGTKGKEGDEVKYRFGAEIIDNENYKFTTDDLLDQQSIPTITVTNGPNKPPRAQFTVDRTNILVGETVTFSSASDDPDGKIEKYIWDVEGDGFHNNQPTNQSTITHVYKSAIKNGAKVRLKVIDDNYAEATSNPVTIFVDSNSKPPTAAFKFSQTQGLTVKFENNSTADPDTKATIVKNRWDFDISSTEETADSDGDGAKDNDNDSTEKDPEFTFKSPGIYRTKLYVEDNDGNTDEVINFVNVKEAKITRPTAIDNTKNDPFKGQFPAVVTGKPSAPETIKPEARLLSNPPTSPDNKIHIKGSEGTITFDFTGSVGDLVELYFDKNIYFDTNGNGINDDDKDYKTTRPGTWTTNFNQEWGRTKVRLTVVDSDGVSDKVEKEIVFDDEPDNKETITKPNPLLGPGGKISGNSFGAFQDISGAWLILGLVFGIISLTLSRLKRSS